MKREVVNKVEKDVVRLAEVDSDKYYGTVEPLSPSFTETQRQYQPRGFITCDWEYKWGYILPKDLMEGLLLPASVDEGSPPRTKLEMFIEALLEDGYKVYEFDSVKELMEWCLED